ncbi:FtsX-like permease family protein [Streptomyces sp. NPDC060205]|uniref:FtsX-like permease family protein n=1 Tax=Streptomyces sp. NPDC060205 TaxID=3347072 RepID=UPI00366468AE
MNIRLWSRDLSLGARFAVTGGREGWTRTLLTALGVALGATLLLLTTAIPSAVDARDERTRARDVGASAERAGDDTLLITQVDSTFRDQNVTGRLVRAEGAKAPVPPGLTRLPAAGEMMVSPALAELLKSADGRKLLAPRLPYAKVGTVAPEGLLGPREVAYWAGSDQLKAAEGPVTRIRGFGDQQPDAAWDPVLLLLILIALIALLAPVAVFIAAAVRVGGEQRDRRLAAFRLVGAEIAVTRRIAAGEVLAGSLLGLALSVGLFALARGLAGVLPFTETGFLPSDLTPSPLLAGLVCVAVPVSAVLVTLLAMRAVLIEPLGVVRKARPARRKVWWRIALPVLGALLLLPLAGGGKGVEFNQWQVTAGVVLLLLGVTVLLPWVVEAVVPRLPKGGVSWQLAVRRLELSSGNAARSVNGIAVAVAGAIALQCLFVGIEGSYTKATGADTERAQQQILAPWAVSSAEMRTYTKSMTDARGVRRATTLASAEATLDRDNPEAYVSLTVADCIDLRQIATLRTCEDGDVFLLGGKGDEARGDGTRWLKPGREVFITVPDVEDEPSKPVAWKVPQGAAKAASRPDPSGVRRDGLLVTPGALPSLPPGTLNHNAFVSLDESVPDAVEYLRNAVGRADPRLVPMTLRAEQVNDRFATIKRALIAGSSAVLLMIGASLCVAQAEQLRERRRLLAALLAFGTRRRTLALSVLWQTAIPMALGLILAVGTGITLGAVLLRMVERSVRIDWTAVATLSGAGAAVVLAVTVVTLPLLWRLMRPDGLRAE